MIGISIIARLESSRLIQKHLIKAAGKPFLEWLILRLKYTFAKEVATGKLEICITTSDTTLNRIFSQFESIDGVSVFYGNDTNIPLRLKECATARSWEAVISVDGDDILCSPEACKKVYEALLAGKKFVKTEGLPLGMNASGFSATYLREVVQDNNEVLETGWGRIFSADPHIIPLKTLTTEPLRFTLDYPEDANFFEAVINSSVPENIIRATDQEIVETVLANKYYSLNEQLNDIYWTNFHNQIEKEQDEQ
jgi:spore coat polysaccharide biosynthesis protein SpsF (cytidylyltransferase family)